MAQPKSFRQRVKPFVLPLAMVVGALFHNSIETLQPIAPALLFTMLLVTFCKVRPSDFRLGGFSWSLIACQIGGELIAFALLMPLLGRDVALGAMLCFLCPTATAAPVVTGMLGGNVARVAAYSMLSNVTAALTAPLLFSWLGGADAIDFVGACSLIAIKVVPLILAPLLMALLMSRLAPKAHAELARRQDLSFYIWAFAIVIVIGNAVGYVIRHHDNMVLMALLAGVSLLACLCQFGTGRLIGRRYSDAVAGAQALGQKNTALAVWMALTFLHPVTSVAPAAYVAWQNIINSLQIYFKNRAENL